MAKVLPSTAGEVSIGILSGTPFSPYVSDLLGRRATQASNSCHAQSNSAPSGSSQRFLIAGGLESQAARSVPFKRRRRMQPSNGF
ncbi:hypothetical protein BDR06DRAFT_1013024 [Suillus hirtellus]|nr:hypothetical protein BDR06DRAFT_1013024 [Suillus hirtellus]